MIAWSVRNTFWRAQNTVRLAGHLLPQRCGKQQYRTVLITSQITGELHEALRVVERLKFVGFVASSKSLTLNTFKV